MLRALTFLRTTRVNLHSNLHFDSFGPYKNYSNYVLNPYYSTFVDNKFLESNIGHSSPKTWQLYLLSRMSIRMKNKNKTEHIPSSSIASVTLVKTLPQKGFFSEKLQLKRFCLGKITANASLQSIVANSRISKNRQSTKSFLLFRESNFDGNELTVTAHLYRRTSTNFDKDLFYSKARLV